MPAVFNNPEGTGGSKPPFSTEKLRAWRKNSTCKAERPPQCMRNYMEEPGTQQEKFPVQLKTESVP